MLDDDKIIEAINNNDNSYVLNTLYTHVLPAVTSFILSKGGNKEHAKDCFQDAVVSLILAIKADKRERPQSVKNYVFIAARNRWYTLVKRKISKEDSIEGIDIAEEETTRHERRRMVLAHLMDKIGDRCKRLLQARIVKGKNLDEICQDMEFSSTEVAKTNIYRCKQKLKNLVQSTPHLKDQLYS